MKKTMTYPGLRALEWCQSLEDPTVRSLRWIPTQQLPEGAVIWVQDSEAYFHFHRVQSRPDDASSVINGMNGGQWVKGVGQARREVQNYYLADAVTGAGETTVATLNMRSVLAGDHLLFTYNGAIYNTAGGLEIISVRAGGVLVEQMGQYCSAGAGHIEIVNITRYITVGAAPLDPYPVVVSIAMAATSGATRNGLIVQTVD